MNTLRLLYSLLFQDKSFGCLWICHGHQEVKIHTHFTPGEVFINTGESCPHHGCGSVRDGFDVRIIENGFVIVCDVKSHRRKITWVALEYKRM